MTRFCLMSAATVLVAAISSYGCSGSDASGNGGDGGSGGTAATGGTRGPGGSGGNGGMDDPCAGVDCTSDNQCVQDGTCDPADGSCILGDSQPLDTPCDLLGSGDGLCDSGGTCGECNDALDCPEPDQCLVSTCVESTCGEEAGPDDVACDLLAVDDGVCDNGECVEPPPCIIADACPDVACTVKDCVLEMCTYSATDGASCEVEPGLPGACEGTTCVGLCEGVTCPSLNDCVMDGTCDDQTGDCIPGDNEPGGTECTAPDGNVCDGQGTCVECTSDAQCSAGQTCGDNDKCVIECPTASAPAFVEDFEMEGPWSPDNGVWQIGEATSGPGSCFGGSLGCAGTILDGNYPPTSGAGTETSSRLISGTIGLPSVGVNEELHLRFRSWSEYGRENSVVDSGTVQISVRDGGGTFGAWESVGTPVSDQSGVWTIKDVDLTAYAGETVRIGFLHHEIDSTGQGGNPVGAGWYIDDIQIRTF